MKIKLTKQLTHTLTELLKCDIALEWINVFKIWGVALFSLWVSIFFNALKSNVKWPRDGFVKVSSLVHYQDFIH